jgi:osmoprotectant transport system permease protein
VIFDAANTHTFLEAFRFIGDHPGFLAHKALQTLELSGAALGLGAAVALPVGIVLGHFHRGSGIATGPMLTNAYDGVDGVDREIVEAARGMGMSHLQILGRVELPLATPLLFTGIRVSAVTVVATAPIAAIAGGGGLGDVIVNQASYRLQGVLGASYCVMALSAGVWLALLALQRALTPRALLDSRVPGADDDRRELL